VVTCTRVYVSFSTGILTMILHGTEEEFVAAVVAVTDREGLQ
jgi:hypothetical protein